MWIAPTDANGIERWADGSINGIAHLRITTTEFGRVLEWELPSRADGRDPMDTEVLTRLGHVMTRSCHD